MAHNETLFSLAIMRIESLVTLILINFPNRNNRRRTSIKSSPLAHFGACDNTRWNINLSKKHILLFVGRRSAMQTEQQNIIIVEIHYERSRVRIRIRKRRRRRQTGIRKCAVVAWIPSLPYLPSLAPRRELFCFPNKQRHEVERNFAHPNHRK